MILRDPLQPSSNFTRQNRDKVFPFDEQLYLSSVSFYWKEIDFFWGGEGGERAQNRGPTTAQVELRISSGGIVHLVLLFKLLIKYSDSLPIPCTAKIRGEFKVLSEPILISTFIPPPAPPLLTVIEQIVNTYRLHPSNVGILPAGKRIVGSIANYG